MNDSSSPWPRADLRALSGEMGKLMFDHDWSGTELAPPWPMQLRTLVELMLTANQPMFILWGKEQLTLYNSSYATILGAKHPWAMGKPFFEIWPEILGGLVEELVTSAYQGKPAYMDDISLMLDTGFGLEEKHFAFSYTPIRDENGQVQGMICPCTDTTQAVMNKRLAEEAQQALIFMNETLETQVAERSASLLLWENIVKSDRAPVLAFDTDFRVVAFNDAHNDEFFRINGFYSNPGDIFPDLFAEDQREGMRALMSRVLSGERFTVVEAFGRPEFGKPFWEIHYTPLRNKDGEIIGAFHHAKDISARLTAEADLSEAQEKLRQTQKLESLGQVTGGVAHDFNNLLTPIMGSLDFLVHKGIGGPREQRMIGAALQSAEKAKVLVQRLLAFARRQPLKKEVIDVSALIDNMRVLLATATGTNIELKFNLQSQLLALADANQIEMAILNIAVNSRDAMPDGGHITISAHDIDGHVAIDIEDSGTGMSDDILARAIEPFYSTKGVGAGTGLGLSMVHGVVSQLGGKLEITSEVNKGTMARMLLPQAEREVIKEDVSPPSSVLPSNLRVLLVDDDLLVRQATYEMLVEMGFSITVTDNASDALKILETQEIDLLITDHMMPKMTGAELVKLVFDRWPRVASLVVTGYGRFEELDGIAVLAKPFRFDDLATTVASLNLTSGHDFNK